MSGARRYVFPGALLVGAATLIACGGADTASPPQQAPPPAALRLAHADTIVRGQPFSLTVTALDARGQVNTGWSGPVSLSASAGTLTPATVNVASGLATVQATLSQHAGDVTITSSVGSVADSRSVAVLSGEAAASLEIHPSSFLLEAIGATQALSVSAFDAAGLPTRASVTWESTSPGVVTVAATGLATAAALGSAQLVARAGSITSAPVMAVVAVPAAGAALVADEHIIGAYTVIDTAAGYGPGWRYRVRLQGVTPQVGQLLLARGAKALGGRVLAVQAAGTATDVTLELVPMRDLLPTLSIHETIPLRIEQPGSPAGNRNALAALYENEFDRAPFKCAVKLTQPNTNPFTMASVITNITPTLIADIIQTPTQNRFVVRGGLFGTLNVKPVLTAALEGSLECKAQIGEIAIPMPGALAFFFAATVPVGLGFEVNGGVTVATLGVDLSVSAAATISMGWDCNPGCGSIFTATGTATGDVKPDIPNPGSDFRVTAGVRAFAWAELEVGPPVFFPGSANLRFKPLEAKAGLKQDFNLSTAEVQATDAAYASSFSLALFFSGGTTQDLQQVLTQFGILMAPLTYSATGAPIAQSPAGTLAIVPARVRGSTPTLTGDTATFIVDLNRTTYLTRYAVESVHLFRQASDTGALVPAPGSCASITATTSGQSRFTCKTDLPTSMAGPQTFFAFVKPILGGALPILLEVKNDSKETITVDHTIYFNDFTSGTPGSEWSSGPTTTSPSGQRFLGTFGNASTTLTLDSLPAHSQIELEFDIYIVESWNGNGGAGGAADIIAISLIGGSTLKRTTFSNRTRDPQAFPGDYPGASNPAGTGAYATDGLGYPRSSDGFGDSSYRLRFTFNHVGTSVAIRFASQQSSGQNERWGIDNVRVNIVP